MNLKRKTQWTLLICLPLLFGAVLYEECNLKPRETVKGESSTLRVAQATLLGDTATVRNIAIFLCTEQDSMYNNCECTQNIPLIDGIIRMEPVEQQEIYAAQSAMVYSYSPYKSDQCVDSVHWSIDDFEPLLVGIPQLVTSHFPEASLEFTPLLGKLTVFLDDKPCEEMTLSAPIPLEGSVSLLTGNSTIEKELPCLHVMSSEQLLFPTYYKDMRIHIGEEDYCIDAHIVSGMNTWVYCRSDSPMVRTEIRTW